MDNILFINACVRPQSRTLLLAREVLRHLDGAVRELRLEDEPLTPHTSESLTRRNALLAGGVLDDPMFRYAWQFRDADVIVIAAPYYDLSFPASLKLYLEQICCVGLTFAYDAQELPQSLCRGKRLIYVSTSGAEFLPDFGYGYVKRLFGEFFHIFDCQCFYAEKLDLRDSDPSAIMARAVETIRRDMEQEEAK